MTAGALRVVAVVPAKDRADTVGDTVSALLGLSAVDEVVVVDDGSRDGTAAAALGAGARVVRLPDNVGKGGAVAAGVAAAPDADVYLLVDADVGSTAGLVDELLQPLVDDEADMTIAVLPPAGRRGGFGKVRDLARHGIRRGSGFESRAPLSGQRAVRGPLLRSLDLAARFGLEVGLTIDAVRAGARVHEVDVAMDHRHTGRSVSGFRHRARQGADIVRALWPRLVDERLRLGALVVATVLFIGLSFVSAARAEPSSAPPAARPSKVVLVGVPGLGWDDVGTGRLPVLDRVLRGGAVAATSVRTASHTPTPLEGYATLGAGARVKADPAAARDGMPGLIELNNGRHLPSLPGALGDALHGAGRTTAVVGSPDALFALADGRGRVDRVQAALDATALSADVLLVDVGRSGADEALGYLISQAPSGTLVLVVSVTPPGTEWHTTPMVAWGAGVRAGYLHSPSVRRLGVVTLTDVAPTVLESVGVPVPRKMIGHPLRYHPSSDVELGKLRRLDRDAAFRERLYFPITLAYIVFQALVYLFVMLSVGVRGRLGRAGPVVRWIGLGIAAWPLATFVLRAIPGVARLGMGPAVVALLLAVDAVLVLAAVRLAPRRHPLSPLSWILGAMVALIVLDLATGARLQTSSVLGYSLHTAARFTGLGNTAFAVLAASALLLGVMHVQYAAPARRREAVWAAGALFALVIVFDGAPALGDDVGGILTLVPVLGLTLLALSGRRVRVRTLVFAGVCALAVLAVAVGLDLLRAPESRTHLGQLVADMRHGGSGSFTTTVARKFSTNLRTYKSVWLWVIVIIAAYLLFFVARGRLWTRLAPKGSALRVGTLAVLATGLAGNFLNDSGAVVTALVFVYLGPFLTLLAVQSERGSPSMLSSGSSQSQGWAQSQEQPQ